MSARDAGLVLSRIQVNEAARGKGEASKVFAEMLAFADEHGQTIALTPDPIGKGGLSKAALTKWYRSHGFVPNKGRAKDYAFRESMIRPPRKR